MKIQNLLLIFTHIVSILSLGILFNFVVEIYDPTYPNVVHKTLYIERNFNQDEVAMITNAAIAWTQATHHIAEINVVTLPTSEKMDLINGIVVLKETSDFPEIIVLDGANENSTVGYCNKHGVIPYIALVSDRLKDDDDEFQTVIIHELGHALGLQHTHGIAGMNSVMYPNVLVSADHITSLDLEQFCSLYHCDANKLKN
jgi:hypothetical protein